MPARNGKHYIARLKESEKDREVWLEGERITNLTGHQAFKNTVESLAHLYDMQHDPAFEGRLTYQLDSGECAGLSFLMPRSIDDLKRRGGMLKVWAETTCGMMGRSPDFLNVAIMVFAAGKDFFGRAGKQFADNVQRYYEYCRDHDLLLTHAIIDPQVDRSKARHEQTQPYTILGRVKETDQGIVVRGAKMLATLGPLADELLVYPFGFYTEPESIYALSFGIPIATSGLKMICRESFDRGRARFDRPLSSRFDEIDAVLIFDDVLIPWERVFINGNIELANTFRRELDFGHLGHQGAIRDLAKMEFLVGVACLMAQTIGIDKFLHIQEMIGEMISYVELVRAAVEGAEAEAKLSRWGIVSPRPEVLMTIVQTVSPKVYPKMVKTLQLLGAGGLMMIPTERDLESPISGEIEKYFHGQDVPAKERIALFRLAWDIAGTSFGSRQELYERFYAGDPVRATAARYLNYSKKLELMERVKEFLKG
jgi:4-hydroxyphenylacetate 3-monooxygenase oxygenase component